VSIDGSSESGQQADAVSQDPFEAIVTKYKLFHSTLAKDLVMATAVSGREEEVLVSNNIIAVVLAQAVDY
jgi:hypothetical protein